MRIVHTVLFAVLLLAVAVPSVFATPPVRIIPEPQQLEWTQAEGFRVNTKTRIVINANPDQKDTFTAAQLRRKIWDTTGHLLTVVRGKPAAPIHNVIAIGGRSKNASVAAIVKSWRDARGKKARSEGYILGVRRDSIVIDGFDQSGVFYGCQTLIQLLERYGTKPVGSLFCYDYPDMAFRGMLVGAKGDFDLDFGKEVVSEIMARYKMNWLEMYVGSSAFWKSHPELGPGPGGPPTTKLVALSDFAKRHFMEFVPAGVDWVWGDAWVARDGRNQDIVENKGGKDSLDLCSRNPKAQMLVRELRDDIIATFRPKYFLMSGLSEAAVVVSPDCPLCKGKTVVETYNEIMKRDAAYFASKGVRPMMWGDMVRTDMPAGEKFETHKCVPTLPRSIIIQDWDYSTKTDFPSSMTWKRNGLDFIASPYGYGERGYVGKENIYYWATSAKKYGARGMVAFNKFPVGNKEPLLNNDIRMADLACYPFVAEWSWSVGKPAWNPAPYDGREQAKLRLAPDRPYWLEASAGKSGIVLKWTNPPENKFQGTWICYRTDKYPIDPTDGRLVCDHLGKPRTQQQFVHRNAPRGTIYYSAFSHDGVRLFSAAAHTSVRQLERR